MRISFRQVFYKILVLCYWSFFISSSRQLNSLKTIQFSSSLVLASTRLLEMTSKLSTLSGSSVG